MKVVTIGRRSDNDVVVKDTIVGRNHVQIIQHDDGHFTVVNLNSTNGTFVNGKRINGEVKLNPYDEVRIGNTILPWTSYFPTSAQPAPKRKKRRTLLLILGIVGGLAVLCLGLVLLLGRGEPNKEAVNTEAANEDKPTIMDTQESLIFPDSRSDIHPADKIHSEAQPVEDKAETQTKEDKKPKLKEDSEKENIKAEQERKRQEAERKAEEDARKAKEDARKADSARLSDKAYRDAIRAEGWVDLGLPSGTLWNLKNEGNYTYEKAKSKFYDALPKKEHFEELKQYCTWTESPEGYTIVGPNGEAFFLPYGGIRKTDDNGNTRLCYKGCYWTSTRENGGVWSLNYQKMENTSNYSYEYAVRLVKYEEKQEYVDLGLPSGTKWATINEKGLYSYDNAISSFGNNVPTLKQFEELKTYCTWTWDYRRGYIVIGPNGKRIFFPAAGYIDGKSLKREDVDRRGFYWFSVPDGEMSYFIYFGSNHVLFSNDYKQKKLKSNISERGQLSVRLVQNP